MKKYKLIAPLFAMASIATLAMPLTSCGSKDKEGGTEYDPEDGPFVPDIEKADPDSMATEDANVAYFEAVGQNPEILTQDYLWSNFGEEDTNPEPEPEVEVVSVVVDCKVVDIEKQLFTVKLKTVVKQDGQKSEIDLTYKNFRFVLMFVNNEAIITPDVEYVHSKTNWSFSGNNLGEGEEIDINKDSDESLKTILQSIILMMGRFKSYYFSDIKPDPLQVLNVKAADPEAPVTSISVTDLTAESTIPFVPFFGEVEIHWTGEHMEDYEVVMTVDGKEIKQSPTTWMGLGGFGDPYHTDCGFVIYDQSFVNNKDVIINLKWL